jgi:hypothetical protein
MAKYLSPSMQFVENKNVNCTILLKEDSHKTWTNTCLQNALHSPATVCFFDGLDYNPKIYSIILLSEYCINTNDCWCTT